MIFRTKNNIKMRTTLTYKICNWCQKGEFFTRVPIRTKRTWGAVQQLLIPKKGAVDDSVEISLVVFTSLWIIWCAEIFGLVKANARFSKWKNYVSKLNVVRVPISLTLLKQILENTLCLAEHCRSRLIWSIKRLSNAFQFKTTKYGVSLCNVARDW